MANVSFLVYNIIVFLTGMSSSSVILIATSIINHIQLTSLSSQLSNLMCIIGKHYHLIPVSIKTCILFIHFKLIKKN